MILNDLEFEVIIAKMTTDVLDAGLWDDRKRPQKKVKATLTFREIICAPALHSPYKAVYQIWSVYSSSGFGDMFDRIPKIVGSCDLSHAHFQGKLFVCPLAFPIQSCIPNMKSLAQVVFEILRSKRIGVTSLTFQGHVRSSVTWPFDSPYAISYW